MSNRPFPHNARGGTRELEGLGCKLKLTDIRDGDGLA